jgi:hypothetical protein
MRIALKAVLGALVLLLVQPVLAQQEPPAAASPEPAPSQAPEACQPERTEPAAYWKKARQWLGSRHEAEGKLLLRDLARDYPDSPEGRDAASYLGGLGELDRSGRIEFIAGNTIMGAYFGYSLALGIALSRDDDVGNVDSSLQTALWSSLGGGLVGLGASALASNWMNVSKSQALLYNFSWAWGWTNGFLVYDLVFPFDPDEALIAGAGGMALGAGTSLLLWRHLNVDEGAAQMAVSTALYSLELIALAETAIGGAHVYRDNETAALVGLLVPANAAVVGGYLLGRHLRWTADDVRLLSLGGFLGNLAGAAIWATAKPGPRSGSVILASSVVVGLAVGTLMVRPWRRAGESTLAGEVGTGLLHLGLRGWSVQPPLPMMVPVASHGRTGVGVSFPVLSSSL